MRPNHLLFRLLLVLAFFSAAMNAQNMGGISMDLAEYFPWIKKGKLGRLDVALGDKRVARTVAYVDKSSGKSITLSGNLGGISTVLSVEMPSDWAEADVAAKLPEFLAVLSPEKAFVLNENYVKEYQEVLAFERELTKLAEDKRTVSEGSLAMIRRLMPAMSRGKENAWSLEFRTLDDSGLVTEWRITGREKPMVVSSIEMKHLSNGPRLLPIPRF
jgi:hypothetical protein